MKNRVVYHKLLLLLCTLFGGLVSLVAGQYYYFDTGGTNYPLQQGCSETLGIRVNTEAGYGSRAGLLRLQFDPLHFSYSTSSLASTLQTDLFLASTQTFMLYTNPSMSPGRLDTGATILQIDRYNPSTDYLGSNGLYGTLKFIPRYNASEYTGIFSMIYNGDTVRTTLSMVGGINTIIPAHQNVRLTGYYHIVQTPCVDDTTPPTVTMNVPAAGTRKSHLSGIALVLDENGGSTNVPYARTGGLPGVGVWTGNIRSLTNQYGVDFSTFQISVSGNGTSRYFTGGMFSPAGTLSSIANGITRQFRDKNYTVAISGSQLFPYGIEKPIIITGNVRDRNNNITSFSRTINLPVAPRLIPGSPDPAAGATSVTTTAPVRLGIADDRAGVNPSTVRVTLQGIGGTVYGPYVFSGSDLNLSGVVGAADLPDQYITISGHIAFPSSGTIQVSVYAEDMEGNASSIASYSFGTRPSCVDLGCCNPVYIQTGMNAPWLYSGWTLNVSGGINPSFTINGNTGTLDCGMRNEGIHIYKGTEDSTGTAMHPGLFGFPNLILSGTNVKAVLSGKTITLRKIYIPPFTGGCIGVCTGVGPGGGGGGGGGGLTKDDCLLPSTLACANKQGHDKSPSYYDNTCCAEKEEEGHGAAGCDISDPSGYSQEISDAYQRGYNLNITNKCPIDAANLQEPLLRKDLAKIMTMYMIQVAGIFPETHKPGCDAFSDVYNISEEMQFFTKTACQLYVMGLHPNGQTPKAVFDPNNPVPRTELGTVLSRLIYGDTFNVHTGEELMFKRYEKHLRALYEDNIMHKIDNPFMIETRARALLMLKRITDGHLIEIYRLAAPAHNGAIVLLENVR